MEKQFSTACNWAIKQVSGGQVDVDFIAQYLVLAHAADHPDIVSQDAGHVFRTAAEKGLIDAESAAALDDAKSLYRDLQTFLALTIDGDMTDAKVDAFSVPLREDLAQITGSADFEALTERLTQTQRTVRTLFRQIVGDPAKAGEPEDPGV
jgi:[glutamine synthetase] adenylyltransferase / [glutamine synthetase]-adenylyl-L-tyrosine phosphorylase